MKVKTWTLFVGICVLMLSSCSHSPVFTVEFYQTPTATQSTVPPSATPIPAVPTFTPQINSMPPYFSPVLFGKKYDAHTFFLLLGAVHGQTWDAPAQAASQIEGAWEYDVHTFANKNFQVLGYSPETSPVNGGNYFIQTDSQLDELGMLGVIKGWSVRQGTAQELDSNNKTYQDVVLDWLIQEGVTNPELGTFHIYRIDLEADGVDEIFISATHLDESQHTTQAGDYSIILMRKVNGNDVSTTLVAGDVYDSKKQEMTFPRTFSLANFIDLNQDGVLEVVIDYQKWEGFGASVFQLDGQKLIQRLSAGT